VTIKIRQSSTAAADNWWEWSVWLEGSDQDRDLKDVDHVVYTLHPTFHPPVQVVKDRRSGFKLTSSGWGEFEMHIAIASKDGKVRSRKHWLKLDAPAAGKRAAKARKKPVVYVSAGATDAALARRLREILNGRGLEVQTLDDAPAGLPEEKALDTLLDSADAAVFLLSGRPSLWTYSEIEHALAHQVPHLIPVRVGTTAQLPPRLESFQPLDIGSPDDLDRLANEILATTGEKG
jgi:hypothetical protein